MAVGLRSLEAVRHKTQSLQEQAGADEAQAERLQRELDKERALREHVVGPRLVGVAAANRAPFPPSFPSTHSTQGGTLLQNAPLLFLLLFDAISRSENAPGFYVALKPDAGDWLKTLSHISEGILKVFRGLAPTL
uniref:Uncharacterized protein n=1 Tax=Anolis carolinensis TaxID=28377 RepID=A0A803SVN1_ANOCA